MSASRCEANGAAAASSNATTRTPASAARACGSSAICLAFLALRLLGLGEEIEGGGVGALPDHYRAAVLDHHLAVLVQPARAHLDEALLGTAARLAHLQHLALRVERVAGVERVGQRDLVPAEREAVLRHVGHAHASDDREGERAV